jgi:hypothetical protein
VIYSPAVLGAGTVRELQTRADTPLLVIGRDRFTRRDLAKIGSFNYIAAANLSAALSTMAIKSTQDLFDRVPPRALALPRIGVFALSVLGACFELKGVGGAEPLAAWVSAHRIETDRKQIVTFHTVKQRAAAAQAAASRRRKTR